MMRDHERRRTELLALLEADSREEETHARRGLMAPAIAVGAVIAVGAGVVWAQTGSGSAGAPRQVSAAAGRQPDQGVAQGKARLGDAVPWGIAEAAMAECLARTPDLTVAVPTSQATGAPSSSDGNVESSGPADGPAGSPASRPYRPPLAWSVTAPAAAFHPYFTAWAADGKGGLQPYVIAAAPEQVGYVACSGSPVAPDLPAPAAAAPLDGVLDVQSARQGTLWGRAAGPVARIEVTDRDGRVLPGVTVVIRDGIWFAGALTPIKGGEVAVRAYDRNGTLLSEKNS
jgi:hypothetical protein